MNILRSAKNFVHLSQKTEHEYLRCFRPKLKQYLGLGQTLSSTSNASSSSSTSSLTLTTSESEYEWLLGRLCLTPPSPKKFSRNGQHRKQNSVHVSTLLQSTSKISCNIHCGFHCSSHLQDDGNKYEPTELNDLQYAAYVEETLDSLIEFFDELQEVAPCSEDYDAAFGNGVLTVHMSGSDGTYVINKQTPNKQIWLSSPITGPKRYDYCNGKWIYVRDGSGLHKLLEQEIGEILGVEVSMSRCKFYS